MTEKKMGCKLADIILYEVQELESGRHVFSEGWKVADIDFL